jgi:hydrogenase nickel incorporation protein HypA/HybF
MHEMALAMSVVQIVEEAARGHPGARVTSVRLEIGALAAVECEALRFCFDAAARGGVAAEARLEILELPGSGWCLQCDRPVPMGAPLAACPLCGSERVQPTGGTGMRVKDFEIA